MKEEQKVILFTREHTVDEKLSTKLKQAGYNVKHIPLICCQLCQLPSTLHQAIEESQWVFFTSAVAVDYFMPFYQNHLKCATIGIQTSQALLAHGITPTFEATSHYAKDFAQEWFNQFKLTNQKIVLPQSQLASSVLKENLIDLKQEVFAFSLYETVMNQNGQAELKTFYAQKRVPEHILTFASPSAFKAFYDILPTLKNIPKIAVIGETTKKAVNDTNYYTVTYCPKIPSLSEMVHEILKNEENDYDTF